MNFGMEYFDTCVTSAKDKLVGINKAIAINGNNLMILQK